MEEDTGMSSTISPSVSSSSHLQVMVHPLSMVSMADHCTRCCMYHDGTPIHEKEDMNTYNNDSVPLQQQQQQQQQPIVGLLFGTVSEHKKTQPSSTSSTFNTSTVVVIHISDAEDVPILYQNSVNAALTAIELHQAVYTNHICIGWYRVNVVIPKVMDINKDSDASSLPPPTPTADDLILSQQLLQQYSISNSTTGSNNNNNMSTTPPFIFALLNVVHEIPPQDDPNPLDTKIITSSTTTTTATVSSLAEQLLQQKKKKKNNDNDDTKNNENDIPLSLYVVDTQQQVLIGLDYDSITTPSSDTNRSDTGSTGSTLPHINTMNYSWKLVTAPYERIAVERIMEYNSKNNNNNNHHHPSTNIQQSLYAIYERLDTLECTLQRLLLLQNKATTATANPSTFVLLRHVNSLLLHVSMMSSILIPSTGITSESTTTAATTKASVDRTTTTATTNTATANTTQLLQQLVTLSETISTIQQYTDKLHIVQQYHRDTTSPNMILKTTNTKNTMANMGGNPNTMDTTTATTSSRQHTRLNYSMYD